MGKRGAAVLLALLVTASAAAGTVSGKVILVKDGKELPDASNAVVWVEGTRRPAGSPATAAGAPSGEMKSASKRFQPRVVAVPKNTTVEFPNADPIYHNVFSVSGANRFDLGLYRSGATKPKTFEEAGLVRVYCNIHPQMVGFVMVVDSDYVAVTPPGGGFEIAERARGSARPEGLARGSPGGAEHSDHGQGVGRRLAGRAHPDRRLGLQGRAAQEQVRQGVQAAAGRRR